MTKKKEQDKKKERVRYNPILKKIKPNDLMAFVYYCKVTQVDKNRLEVHNLDVPMDFEVNGSELIENGYSADQFSETLLKMMTNEPLSIRDVNILKGALGQVQGWMSNTLEDEIQETQQLQSKADSVATTTSSLDQGATGVAPKLNIPGVSPASSLSGVNITGAMTSATTPNTLQKGQALFGANDPIFGGIGSVS